MSDDGDEFLHLDKAMKKCMEEALEQSHWNNIQAWPSGSITIDGPQPLYSSLIGKYVDARTGEVVDPQPSERRPRGANNI